MLQLEELQLENVRRFGKRVIIPISSGATVFYAPNGTGKTSLFEAMELCLTGQIRRLTSSGDAIIRDSFQQAFVEMKFTEDLLCKASMLKGKAAVCEGDQSTIFSGTSNADIPYLLRLTHLLQQSSADWFVQTKSDDAGSLLEKLSIGREAATVQDKMNAVKKAFTGMITEAERAVKESDDHFFTWNRLMERKRISDSSLQSDLVPLETILEQLNAIIGKLSGVASLNKTETNPLRSKCAETAAVLEMEAKKLRSRIEILEALGAVVKDFEALLLQSEKATSDLNSKRDAKPALDKQEGELQKAVNELQEKLRKDRALLLKIDQYMQLTTDIAQAEKDASQAKELVDKLPGQLKTLKSQYATEQQKLEAENKLRQQWHGLSLKTEALQKEQQTITQHSAYITEWNTKLQELQTKREEQEKLQKVIGELQEKTLQFEKEVATANHLYAAASNQVTDLMSAADIIKSAVAMIAANIAPDASQCPVCLSDFPGGELASRMQEALRLIQPGLDAANKNMLDAKLVWDDKQRVHLTNNNSIKDNQQALVKIVKEIEGLQASIISLKSYFPGVTDLEHARQQLGKLRSENETGIKQNETDKTGLAAQMSAPDWALLNDRVKQLMNDISKLEKDVNAATAKNEELQKRVEGLKHTLATDFKDHTSQSREEVQRTIQTTELAFQTETNKLTDSRRLVNEMTLSISRAEQLLEETQRQIAALFARWQGAGLPGNPEQLVMDDAKMNLRGLLESMKTDTGKVEKFTAELAKWGIAEENKEIDAEISKVQGAHSIEAYAESLSTSKQEKQRALKEIKEKSNAVTYFSKQLQSEITKIQDYLTAMNVPWKELLKKVVLDPRFADTVLKAYSHYNRQHAEVNVKLHGSDVPAKYVASEAQITDLQLTFLLSMALMHKWTPWKALLLDDPTQHHDLVHASSVFDVLRDYIIEHKFQVILATHDSTHAKFFMRKLQNDGIPANLIELKATQDGVIACLVNA